MASARTKTPRPGTPVRGSRTGRPIMALLDLLGRRWALRVLWELRDAPATFRALRERCDDISPTVLNARLKELRESGIVELSDDEGYRLTDRGVALRNALVPIAEWADTWGGGGGRKRPS
ncbi:helix-turn-helix transcriptional regulator [Pendulispora brunnea]|uniref:Helix-turn-helix transcriptional regulator n=1 Tax=Pendulispora brunnea TaxID=2905690 RepID=A0ABZ2KA31_9BACT